MSIASQTPNKHITLEFVNFTCLPRLIKLNILFVFVEPIQPQISSTDERKLHDLRPVTLTTEVGTFIKTLETSNVTLTCSATGFPPPIITWKKGITTLEATGNSTYNIHNARVSDTGIYTCTASNLQGFDTRTSNVTIVGKYRETITFMLSHDKKTCSSTETLN